MNAWQALNVALIFGFGFAAGYLIATKRWEKDFDDLDMRIKMIEARVKR